MTIQALKRAVEYSDEDEVRDLLPRCCTSQIEKIQIGQLLEIASTNRQYNIFKLLTEKLRVGYSFEYLYFISNDCDINFFRAGLETASEIHFPSLLQYAIENNCLEIIEIILADPRFEVTSKINDFILITADTDNLEAYKILVADSRFNLGDQHRALLSAVSLGSTAMVREMLKSPVINPYFYKDRLLKMSETKYPEIFALLYSDRQLYNNYQIRLYNFPLHQKISQLKNEITKVELLLLKTDNPLIAISLGVIYEELNLSMRILQKTIK